MSQVVIPQEPRKYDDVRHIAETRGANKFILDGGKKKLRGYSLPQLKLKAKLAEWRATGRFVSPYCKSLQTDHLMALASLGVNEAWSLREVRDRLQEMMSLPERRTEDGVSDWERFEGRKFAKGRPTKPVTECIYDTFRRFRRLCKKGGMNPIGYKLRQMGCALDLFIVDRAMPGGKRRIERYVRLNTHSQKPLLERVASREEISPVDLTRRTYGPKAG